LIPDDFDIHAINTSGESFLHLLNTRHFVTQGIGESSAYLALLKYLKSRRFSFSNRDCHGQTILHILLKRSADAVIDSYEVRSILEGLSEVIKILELDLNALDNQDYNVGDELIAWCDKLPIGESPVHSRMSSLVHRYRSPQNFNISFRLQIYSEN
jgi:hypothetical protein